ncbi:response regulator [Lacimicrobium alkaliphilum]|uniref:LuxR family transcriptional regulator n=1 Tax=Lacimicrobium alkaliphilum TaxID=1526571 RepID=A0A0U2JJH3_9ALTE|nr:response regulator transcription factor [Lacimicrobium alkaliphilum]ALS99574.1 LuxR family transcriptional regulator [Lacimicrobium alkaliphilum]
MIKLLLVDDQQLLRQGIASLLGLSDKVQLMAQANDGEQALNWLQTHPDTVDVVLMDIRMPRMDGIQTLTAMAEQGINIPAIILTTFDDHELLIQALKAGAKGYLLKDVSLEVLVAGIQAVHRGGTLIQPAITSTLIDSLKGLKSDFEHYQQPEALSDKEMEILRLMAAGCSNKEIAQSLFKSEGTVKNQVSNLLSKLGVRDRTRAVLRAIEQGLI